MSHDVDVPLQVIGIGSPFGDDTIGWQAIVRLREEKDILPPSSELHTLDRPGSTLIPLLEKSSQVVLIDAMQSGQLPGMVQRLQPEELIVHARQPSSHGLAVAETLAMAAALKVLPQRLLIYGVEMGDGLIMDEWYPQLTDMLAIDLDYSGLSEIDR